MKRIALLTIVLLAGITAFARQAAEARPQVVSPEILDDNRVTFRLWAPEAIHVQLTGDCLPARQVQTSYGLEEQAGVADMVKNGEGVWEYTTPRGLEPELYSYYFLIDGARITDPLNVHTIRDVAVVASVFIIGGGRADLYRVNDVPHGTVSRLWYDSPALGMRRRLTVYTPAGYEESGRRYPVFYLLHGTGGDEEAWITLGRAAQIMDNLIAQGKAEPMIVVMTNGNTVVEAAPGESSAGFIVPTSDQPGMRDGSFEMSFPDVVNYIDTHYRTLADKRHRALAGLSMGGLHTKNISRQYPDLFDYVGIFSPGIPPSPKVDSPVYEQVEEKLAIQFEKRPACYWIAIGKTDKRYRENKDYCQMLDEKGYPYTYMETEGGHTWRNWRIHLSEFAPLLFK